MHDGKGSECKCFVMDVHAVKDKIKLVLVARIVLVFLLESMLHAMIPNSAARDTRFQKQRPLPHIVYTGDWN